MRDIRLQTIATLLGLFYATLAAQQPQATAAVPKLLRFSGSFRPANGQPAQSVESVTLAVYRDHTGGDALWQEIQDVAVHADGHYSLLMGATRNEGMPLDLFSSGEPRWLGAQFNRPGEAEQPRVLLVSVPYALKASDAETLGGRPASAYLLAGPPVGAAAASTDPITPAISTKATAPVSSGFPNFVAKFVNTTDVGDSPIYDANGYIGISTTQPAISLDVRTGSLPQMGIAGNTDYLTFFASDIYGPAIYWDPAKDMRFGKGGVGLYNPYGFVEQMRIQSSTGNVGIGTQTPTAKLEVNGTVQADGNVTIAALGSGLIFPDGTKQTTAGGGGITGVTAGTDLTGGGTSGTVTLNLDTTKVPTLAAANSFTGSPNAFTGNVGIWTLTPGSKLDVAGDINFDGSIWFQGVPVLQMPGGRYTSNIAVGLYTLVSNTTGTANTATGVAALYNNTSGNNNTAIGFQAAYSVAGGNSNNIHIANRGFSSDSGTVRIGTPGNETSFFAAGVRGVTTGYNDAIPVMIDSVGQLGTVSSSRRFKEDIENMGASSHDLLRLRPVTFRYKEPFADGSKPTQYGLIAEEVAEVYPDLVAHSANGQIETVKYQVLDSMLLNEVQRQQAEIRRLEERLTNLEAALAKGSSVQ